MKKENEMSYQKHPGEHIRLIQNEQVKLPKHDRLKMKTVSFLRAGAFLLVLFCLLNIKTFAWSAPGHMTVAYLAYKSLTPNARARVDKLVAMNPKINLWRSQLPAGISDADSRMMLFMIEATWADQIKSDGEHFQDGTNNGNTPPKDETAAQNIGFSDKAMHKYWHFIDRPFSVDGTALKNPDTPNALTQIKVFRSVLASNENDALKAYDLAWLVHVIGDVHQPLHCAARFTKSTPNGDDGGNGVKFCSPSCDSLHGFWDGIFGTASKPQQAIPRAIKVGNSLNPASQTMVENLEESDWIDESFALAKEIVYKNPPIKTGKGPFNVTDKYRNRAIDKANQQVALAGARLARILNSELK
ncbi:MAG: S1/P1 nuclease [Pyrinomonadaceae bacterium]